MSTLGLPTDSWTKRHSVLAGLCVLVPATLLTALWPFANEVERFRLLTAMMGVLALFLLAITLTILRATVRRHAARTHDLHNRLAEAEARARQDRASVHELKATIAGVRSAQQLLHSRADVPPARRQVLEEMVEGELARLDRLLDRDVKFPAPRSADLDPTISRLVVAQQIRGNQVHWQGSGDRVVAEPDRLAEAVNILLDNAITHGSDETRVEVERRGGTVEIRVSDNGPGVPEEIRERLFDWGVRGPTSRGQGIGLNIARERIEEFGGYLELLDATEGTTFVVGLRAAGDP